MNFFFNALKQSPKMAISNIFKNHPLFCTTYQIAKKDIIINHENDDDDENYKAFADRYFGYATSHNCLIIHPYIKWGPKKPKDTNPQKQLKEAIALIATLSPWKIEDTLTVPLLHFQKKILFGSGNLKRIKNQIEANPNITALFINVAILKNMQVKEMELQFGLPIFDRYKIVIQILKLHAISTHAKLQVALAEIPYLKVNINDDSNFKTATSEDYEVRKFMLQRREQKLKTALKKLHSQRELLRSRRRSMDYPIVAIVGYTNAGKTSLIKALTGDKSLQPKNYLFATLDVTMHTGRLPSTLEAIYVDTVGFISDIPTTLIECFTVTLEDALFADVIIHVEDLSSEDLIHQRNHVLSTLNELAIKTNSEDLLNKIITVGNKYDLCPEINPLPENCILVSATTHLGLDTLRYNIEEKILKVTQRQIITIKVPSGSEEMRWLYKNGAVISTVEDKENQMIKMKTVISESRFEQFKHNFVKMDVTQ